MLVEINLLPKRESRNIAFWLIIMVLAFLFLASAAFTFWQGSRYDHELQTIENEILVTQKLIEAEQAKQDGNQQGTDSAAILQSAVEWSHNEPLKSAPIIQNVTALLPERGFIDNISYAESGDINLTVQFDTSREASYFYKTLLDEEWIASASLSNLSTNELKEETDEEQDSQEKFNALKEAEKILPRYTGIFTIKLSRDYINMQERSSELEANEMGGRGL